MQRENYFGDAEEKDIPLSGRKSISILLRAGFSAPIGYPIGNDINEKLLSFDDRAIDFSPDGTLATSKDRTKPIFQVNGVLNTHQKYSHFANNLSKSILKHMPVSLIMRIFMASSIPQHYSL